MFPEELESVTLKRGEGGVFEVSVNGETIYSKKATGKYPELADLKPLLRQKIAPEVTKKQS